jgi:hypothetical protein
MIKLVNKLGTEETYLNMIMATYDKPVPTRYKREIKRKPLTIKSATIQGYSLFPCLFNIVFEFLARAVRQ